MHPDKKSYLLSFLKIFSIVGTVVLAAVLIYAAYAGLTNPDRSKIAPLAVLAFPYVLALNVLVGLVWLIVRKWRQSLIVWAAMLISWPSVRVVSPLNMFPLSLIHI